jgi:hypothetical protein
MTAPAFAQIGPSSGGSNNAVSLRQKPEDTVSPRQIQPPALPGAQAHGAVAPATKLPSDMSPNEALFDAINRGDIASARDALSRGADLDSHNILGMTPMELSVDLGRNDISFLLLSFRGGDTPRRGPPLPVLAEKPGNGKTKAPAPARIAVVRKAPDQSPKLFANDGGAPVPSAGFLGFDARRGP